MLNEIGEHGRWPMERIPEHWTGRRVLVMLDVRSELEEFAASLESVSSYGVALRYPYPFDTSAETTVFYPWRLVRHIRLDEQDT